MPQHAEVLRILSAGPPPRGKTRRQYKTKDGKERIIYELILDALAKNPPLLEIGINDLFQRIRNLVADEERTIQSTKSVRSALDQWQVIIEGQNALFRVFEWRDDQLHILDNLFLFYLRWVS